MYYPETPYLLTLNLDQYMYLEPSFMSYEIDSREDWAIEENLSKYGITYISRSHDMTFNFHFDSEESLIKYRLMYL